MGYESRIYVVEKSNYQFSGRQKKFAWELVKLELGKSYSLGDWFGKRKETDCYLFQDDGNTEIYVDRYGKPLTEASVEATLQKLEKLASYDDNRSFHTAIAVLKSFADTRENWGDLAVIHYGH